MVSLVINSLSPWLGTNYTAECGGNLPALADSDEPNAGRADDQAVGRLSGIGAEYEAGLARAKDGAGGGPAEEQTCARGCGMRLLKIGGSRTRIRARTGRQCSNGSVEWDSNSLQTEPIRANHPRG